VLDEVVVETAARAQPARQHPLEDPVVRDVDLDHGVDVVALQERQGLGLVAREAVQDEAEVPVVLVQPLLHHLPDQVVGSELARGHDAPDPRAQLRVVLDVPAEDVAYADVHEVEIGLQHLGLRALAAALHAHDHVFPHHTLPAP
jgi:hypothetical protein